MVHIPTKFLNARLASVVIQLNHTQTRTHITYINVCCVMYSCIWPVQCLIELYFVKYITLHRLLEQHGHQQPRRRRWWWWCRRQQQWQRCYFACVWVWWCMQWIAYACLAPHDTAITIVIMANKMRSKQPPPKICSSVIKAKRNDQNAKQKPVQNDWARMAHHSLSFGNHNILD